MDHIDSIRISHGGENRSVNFCIGDLSSLPEENAVDALVVSAFPDDYAPTSGSVIGALHYNRGISVVSLAENKAVDLRQFSSCWLSQVIDNPGAHFRRILCFEPAVRGKATEVVGDIFRSIIPFTTGDPPITSIAMPLVATGIQREEPLLMLDALVDAAVHWLTVGVPLDRIDIVADASADREALAAGFASIKQALAEPELAPPTYEFDAFISYSWENKNAVDLLVNELLTAAPQSRVFLDRLELKPGAAWQQHIFDSLESSRKVICVYSPAYLKSKICQEEYNIALIRHREADEAVLLPVLLTETHLPTYMRLVQYHDATEGERGISQAAAALGALL